MTRDCWQEFALSGKIGDYLQYRKQKEGTQAFTDSFQPGRTNGEYILSQTEEEKEKWNGRQR